METLPHDVLGLIACNLSSFAGCFAFAQVSKTFTAVMRERRAQVIAANSYTTYGVRDGEDEARTMYFTFGLSHREAFDNRGGRLPAIVYDGGLKIWYMFDKVHRDGDLPAITDVTGESHWIIHSEYSRADDKPSYITSGGTHKWVRGYELHRDNDKPAWIERNGQKRWYWLGAQYWPKHFEANTDEIDESHEYTYE
jgi:hypothetical protein